MNDLMFKLEECKLKLSQYSGRYEARIKNQSLYLFGMSYGVIHEIWPSKRKVGKHEKLGLLSDSKIIEMGKQFYRARDCVKNDSVLYQVVRDRGLKLKVWKYNEAVHIRELNLLSLIVEGRKYKSRRDCPGPLLRILKLEGLDDLIFGISKTRVNNITLKLWKYYRSLTIEELAILGREFSSRSECESCNRVLYRVICENRTQELTWGKKLKGDYVKKAKIGTYSFEYCEELASTVNSPAELERLSKYTYEVCRMNGWVDDLFPSGKFKKDFYVIKWTIGKERYAYVGLSVNAEGRLINHVDNARYGDKRKQGNVFFYNLINENGVGDFEVLERSFEGTKKECANREEEWTKYIKDKGYVTLNSDRLHGAGIQQNYRSFIEIMKIIKIEVMSDKLALGRVINRKRKRLISICRDENLDSRLVIKAVNFIGRKYWGRNPQNNSNLKEDEIKFILENVPEATIEDFERLFPWDMSLEKYRSVKFIRRMKKLKVNTSSIFFSCTNIF